MGIRMHSKDRNGQQITLGDYVKVRRRDGEEFVMQVHYINNMGWVWGSDMPDEYKYCLDGTYNFHSRRVIELYRENPKMEPIKYVEKFTF